MLFSPPGQGLAGLFNLAGLDLDHSNGYDACDLPVRLYTATYMPRTA
jgi:hypothetical protein